MLGSIEGRTGRFHHDGFTSPSLMDDSARDRGAGGQDRPAGSCGSAERDLRGRLPRVLVRLPASTWRPRRTASRSFSAAKAGVYPRARPPRISAPASMRVTNNATKLRRNEARRIVDEPARGSHRSAPCRCAIRPDSRCRRWHRPRNANHRARSARRGRARPRGSPRASKPRGRQNALGTSGGAAQALRCRLTSTVISTPSGSLKVSRVNCTERLNPSRRSISTGVTPV